MATHVADSYKYDVSISYDGHDVTFAERLANCLKAKNIYVFFAPHERPQLWGRNMGWLKELYGTKTRLVVAILSPYYCKNDYCMAEFHYAMAQHPKRGGVFLLPWIRTQADCVFDLLRHGPFDPRELSEDEDFVCKEIVSYVRSPRSMDPVAENITSDVKDLENSLSEDDDYIEAGRILAKPIDDKYWYDSGGEITQHPDLYPTSEIRAILEKVIADYTAYPDQYQKMRRRYYEYLGRFNVLLSNVLAFADGKYEDAIRELKLASESYAKLPDQFLFMSSAFESNYLRLQQYMNCLRTTIQLSRPGGCELPVPDAVPGRRWTARLSPPLMVIETFHGRFGLSVGYRVSRSEMGPTTPDLELHRDVVLGTAHLRHNWKTSGASFKDLAATEKNAADKALRAKAAEVFSMITELLEHLLRIKAVDFDPKTNVTREVRWAADYFEKIVKTLDETRNRTLFNEWWYSEFASFLVTLMEFADAFFRDNPKTLLQKKRAGVLDRFRTKADSCAVKSRGLLIEHINRNRWFWPFERF